MLDLVLISFFASAVCLIASGLFNGLWERARAEAGDERLQLGLEWRWGDRLRANRRYFGALFASEGGESGERYRRLAKWSLVGAAVMFICFVAFGLISAVV